MFCIQLKKNKKSSQEIVHCGQVYEKSPPKMKNFDLGLPCDSHSETHRMNKERRDLTSAGDAVQCYHDMRAHHRTYAHSFQIMKVEEIDKLCGFAVKQFQDSKIKLPLPQRKMCHQYASLPRDQIHSSRCRLD